MNPLDTHLKFPDESTATRLMLEAGLLQQRGDLIVQGQGQMIDIIGLIYKPTGAMLTDEQGNQHPEMVDIGGWHVNMRGELPEALTPYKTIVKSTPHRIWD
jgi:hypothetical protein